MRFTNGAAPPGARFRVAADFSVVIEAGPFLAVATTGTKLETFAQFRNRRRVFKNAASGFGFGSGCSARLVGDFPGAGITNLQVGSRMVPGREAIGGKTIGADQ